MLYENKLGEKMKCPHCENKISGKTFNKFGKIKNCEHCNQGMKIAFNFKTLLISILVSASLCGILIPTGQSNNDAFMMLCLGPVIAGLAFAIKFEKA